MKRYVQETGTVWVRVLTASGTGNFFYLARITDVEVTAALARRRGQPGLSVVQAVAALRQFRRDFGQDYRVVEITIALLQRAAQLADTHALRGYDAVQLGGGAGRACPGPGAGAGLGGCRTQRGGNSRGAAGGRSEYASVSQRCRELGGPFRSRSTQPA